MTDISVSRTDYQVDNRSWLIPQPGSVGQGFTPSATLDVSAFPASAKANGYIPSGTAVSQLGNGKWGPLDASANRHGFVYQYVSVPANGADVGTAVVVAFACVRAAKLPDPGVDRSLFSLVYFVD